MSMSAEVATPPTMDVLTEDRSGSDLMVDVLKAMGFEYIFANPGSSFRGLHESIINYGDNKAPEFITCCHEESAVAMAHGYSKIEGKPALVFRARNSWIAACHHGDLQRVLRSRARIYHRRQHDRRHHEAARAWNGITAFRMRRRWCVNS